MKIKTIGSLTKLSSSYFHPRIFGVSLIALVTMYLGMGAMTLDSATSISRDTRPSSRILSFCYGTDGHDSCASVMSPSTVMGTVLSDSGDMVENVIVSLFSQSDSTLLKIDTTDQNGKYDFKMLQGKYFITIHYPPYSSPLSPYFFEIPSGSSIVAPNLILRNAFQLSGTVFSNGKRDQLIGASVTLYGRVYGGTVEYGPRIGTRVTDKNGHFSFGVKTGSYFVHVHYQNTGLGGPLSVLVNSNKTIDLILNLRPTGLPPRTRNQNIKTLSNSDQVFDLKGAVVKKSAASRGKIVFGHSE